MYIIYEANDIFHSIRVEDDTLKVVGQEQVEPEDMPMKLRDILEAKEAEDIYFWEMPRYLVDILRTMYVCGYKPTQGDPEVKKMKERQFKYLITSDYLPYTMTIKRHKRGRRIINADNISKDVGNLAVLLSLIAMSGEKRKCVTISSIARKIWTSFGSNDFYYLKSVLPNAAEIEVYDGETLDAYIREAYRGGFLFDHSDGLKVYEDVYVYDKNSLYPYVATNCPLPYGRAVYEEGSPSDEEWKAARQGYLYLFVKIKVDFDIKTDGIPCIRLRYGDPQTLTHSRDYLRTTKALDGKGKRIPLTLTLTQEDFWLLIENYDILSLEYIDHVKFPTATGLYDDYMRFYYEQKRLAGDRGDSTAKTINKSLLNNCIGSTAKRLEYDNIVIEFDEEGGIHADDIVTYGKKSQVYIGTAVNAKARKIIVDSIKKNPDAWLYSDTDSKHVTEPISGEAIGKEMGEYKLENHFAYAIYYKRKTYIGIRPDGSAKVVIAGLQGKSTQLIADLIEKPSDYIPREKAQIYTLMQEVIELFKVGIPFIGYEELEATGQPFRFNAWQKLESLFDGRSWQDMTEVQEKIFWQIAEVFIKHGKVTREEIYNFIEADTIERRLWSDFHAIFQDYHGDLQELLIHLYTTPIPKFITGSDGNFGKVERVEWIRMDKNYNFL